MSTSRATTKEFGRANRRVRNLGYYKTLRVWPLTSRLVEVGVALVSAFEIPTTLSDRGLGGLPSRYLE